MKSILTKIYNKLWNMKEGLVANLKSLGDKIQVVLPAAYLAYCACFSTNHDSRVFVVSFLSAMGIYLLLNILFYAPRPSRGLGPIVEWNPDINDGANSFPSGHTMAAASGGIFWFEINWWMGCIGLALALTCAFSRLVSKAHWIRDVLTSILISVSIYLIATNYF